MTYAELEQSLQSLTRYIGNPIIPVRTGDYKDSQVNDPIIMIDPENPDQLVMFLTCMATPLSSGEMTIARFTAPLSDPTNWTAYTGNPIFTQQAGTWEEGGSGIRLGSVVYDNGTYYMYYMSYNGTFNIGLATSTDGFTFTREPSNPILTPSGDEATCENGFVIKDGSAWYMYYQYRVGGFQQGIRIATSNNGISWTKTGIEAIAAGDSYDQGGLEWHQIFKLEDEYVMIYECYNGSTFWLAMAHSVNPDAVFIKSSMNPILQPSGQEGAFDRYHVATGAIYVFGDQGYLYYQGASDGGTYTGSHWDLGVATFDLASLPPPSVSGGILYYCNGSSWIQGKIYTNVNETITEGTLFTPAN